MSKSFRKPCCKATERKALVESSLLKCMHFRGLPNGIIAMLEECSLLVVCGTTTCIHLGNILESSGIIGQSGIHFHFL